MLGFLFRTCKDFRNVHALKLVEIKYLGVWIDENLNLNKHVDYVASKMVTKYHTIKRLATKLTTFSLILLCKSIVALHIDYCSSSFLC
jgi:hypothetical protein